MNKVVKLIIVLTTFGLLAGCALPGNTDNIDAQVQTAIAETAQAESVFQAAVDQAVEATVIAMPPTPTAQPTIDPYTLSEEELAALIDASCEEAVAASTEANSATTQATSDGTYTEEELYDSIYYVYDAEAAIAYADELISIYYDLYGAYASEALDLLYAVEGDLEELAYATNEVEAILSLGAEAATAAVDQLNTTIETVQPKVDEIQTKVQEHRDKLPTALSDRENSFLNLAPTEIANDRDGATLQVYAYLDSVKTAFEDRKISPDEMGQIAQLGANAQAGINQGGGPLLKKFSGNIDGITRNISRGNWPTAQRDVGSFEASLPSRPMRR